MTFNLVSMIKQTYESPYARSIDLAFLWDVCNNASLPSSGTDPFTPTSGEGWEDEFNN